MGNEIPKQNTPWGKYILIVGISTFCITLGKIWGDSSCARTSLKYDESTVKIEELDKSNRILKDSLNITTKTVEALKAQLYKLDSVIFFGSKKFIVQDFDATVEDEGFGKYNFIITGNLDTPAPRDIEVRLQIIDFNREFDHKKIVYTGSVDKVRKGKSFFEFKEQVDKYLEGNYIVRFRLEKFKLEKNVYLY